MKGGDAQRAADSPAEGPRAERPSITARALALLYGGGPLLLDERVLLRDAIGPLMARAESADFAVARLRLAAVDLRPAELGALSRCRVLVERLDAVTRGDALAASRAEVQARLHLLLAFLESGRVEVRVGAGRCWTPDFSLFHGIRRGDGQLAPGVAATGAHFFSRPYPVTGPSITCLTGEPGGFALLSERFEELWRAGYDVTFVLADRMRRLVAPGGRGKGTVRERSAPPSAAASAAAARLALAVRFGPDGRGPDARPADPRGNADPRDGRGRVFDLAAFQEDAVARAERALLRHGGVLLADGVGLGKTFLGLALAEIELRRGGRVVVVAPPALRREWLPPLRRLAQCTGTQLGTGAGEDGESGRAARLHWLSHGALSRGGPPPAILGATLVVVDEAHGYRNPGTQRYRALAALCRGARVALLTATPINNTLWDLYFQLRLFAGEGAFAGQGVPDLRQAFAAAVAAGSPTGILPVLREVVIRRTRPFLRDHYGAIRLPGGTAPVSLPRRADPVPVRYTLAASFPGGVAALAALLEQLTLAPYRLAAYGAAPRGTEVAAELLRFSLLKRLESSPAAFGSSLLALEELLRAFADALAQRRLLRPRERALLAAEQLVLGEVALDALPQMADLAGLARDAARDLELLRRLRAGCPAQHDSDPKLGRLRDLIGELGEKVVVFTEFRDTAVQLARGLAPLRVGLVHGGGAWLGQSPIGRRQLIERFAPAANRARPPSAAERVDVLVATDVLSEGLNLQDARCIVSYDLPWNPVRLMQRIGRVDRLGSPHAEVRPFHFVPESGLDELLGLVRRIRGKLTVIRRTVPGDVAVLDAPGFGDPAEDDQGLARVLAGDGRALEEEERAASAAFEIEERLRQLWLRLPASRGEAPRDGPPLTARVPVEGPAGRRVLLCFDLPLPGWLLWDESTGETRDDDLAAADIVAAALAGTGGEPADPAVVAAATEAARAALRRRGSPAPPAPRGRIAAVSRRLLRALTGTRHAPDPDLCARVDLLLHALSRGLDAGTEQALRDVLARSRADSPAGLVEQVEQALNAASTRPLRAPLPDPWGAAWRLRAAIEAVPGGPAAPCHTVAVSACGSGDAAPSGTPLAR